jgi:mono/diheme cytochrome c family protein
VANRVRAAWVFGALLIAGAMVALYYLDLLKAAFASNPVAVSERSIARGRALFSEYCAACHGVGGRGDGPAARSLSKPPEDLTRIAPPPYFPDGVVAYRIVNGGDGMPAWKGVLRDEDVWTLIVFIRTLRREK